RRSRYTSSGKKRNTSGSVRSDDPAVVQYHYHTRDDYHSGSRNCNAFPQSRTSATTLDDRQTGPGRVFADLSLVLWKHHPALIRQSKQLGSIPDEAVQ